MHFQTISCLYSQTLCIVYTDVFQGAAHTTSTGYRPFWLWVIAHWLLPLLQEEEEVQVPEEVEEVEEEVREEGTFEEEAWEGDYQEEYVEAKW